VLADKLEKVIVLCYQCLVFNELLITVHFYDICNFFKDIVAVIATFSMLLITSHDYVCLNQCK